MVPLQSGEESEALRKNGDRPHFLSPFFLGQNQRVLEISTLAHFAFRHKKEDVCGISFCIYTVQFLCYRLGRKI